MSSLLYRMGRSAARRPWMVIGGWLVVAIVVVGSSATFGSDLDDSFGAPGLDSQRAADLLATAGSASAGVTAEVVVSPIDDGATFATSDAARQRLAEVVAETSRLPGVVAVAEPERSGAISPDQRVAVVAVQYDVVDELSAADLDRLQDLVAEASDGVVQVEARGELFFTFDNGETRAQEAVGLLAAMVILLVAFGSLVAMGLPIGMALLGLAIGISSMSLLANLVEVPSYAPILAAMIGLGVGIDYALFVVTRHREQLSAGLDVVHSAGLAVATAGQAVAFAGGTVVIAILGLAVAGVPSLTAAGVAISLVVAIMVVASLTLLPAFLGLAGHRVIRLRAGRRSMTTPVATDGANRRRWERWGAHVARHATLYTVGVTVLLLALTAPVLALRLGFPDDGTAPPSTTQRRAYDLVAEGFGPGFNGPIIVAVDTAGDRAVIDDLTEAIAADGGIAGTTATPLDEETGVGVIVAYPTTAPQDAATVDTIERIRTSVIPPVVGEGPAAAHVGGPTATFTDVGNQIAERLPYFIAAVVVLSFLLLILVFRSILVPLKAAVLNLLSIGASFGVLVAVFQWGWAKELIGLEAPVPIVSFIPLFMFGILFGLSMDYEVFLLSRVREEYVRTGDNDASVIHGIAGTARVITSAALIMISVFAGFVLSEEPSTKMFGLGLAVAIAIDASIVRMVLVPATMKLLGDANWWFPSWLDRLLPAVDLERAPVSPVGSGDQPGRDGRDTEDREPALADTGA